jgi:hypothetical protein
MFCESAKSMDDPMSYSGSKRDLSLRTYRRYCWKRKNLRSLEKRFAKEGLRYGWRRSLKQERRELYVISDNVIGIFDRLFGLVYLKSNDLTLRDKIVLNIFESEYKHKFPRRIIWPIAWPIFSSLVIFILIKLGILPV